MPGSESLGSWTRGLRVTRALAFEAVRFVVAAWLALTLVFLAFQVWPGSPALSFFPHNPQYAGTVQQNVAIFALDQPVWTRYGVWLADAFLGRLGVSYYIRLPVLDVLAPWVPATLELVFGTTLWAVLLGGLLGWAAASRRFRLLGPASRGVGLLLYALPLFWSLIAVLAGVLEAWHVWVGMPLPPDPTRPRPTGFPLLDALLSGNLDEAWLVFWTTALLTLPAGAALGLPILLRVRNALARSRDTPRFAALPPNRGLPLSGAFRSALAPIASGVAAILPFVVSATVFEEWFGNRRGIGWFLLVGLNSLDAPLVQGALTLLAVIALLSAVPFAMLEAGFFRRPVPPPATFARGVPTNAAIEAGMRASAHRLLDRRSVVFWVGLVVVAAPVGLTVLAPLLTPYAPLQRVTDTACSGPTGTVFLQPPCAAHPLGTDYFGYDILSQVLYGGRLVMAETAQALAVSTGVALGLALLCGLVGRWVDVPLRMALGAIAFLPCLVVLFLFFVPGLSTGLGTGGIVLGLEVLFVALLFRDARNLVGPVEHPAPLMTVGGAPTHSPSDRLMASVAAIGPGLIARLPRRLAEMALLFELFAALGLLSPGIPDWARITGEAIGANAIVIGNWGWLLLPGLLLCLYAAGLLLVSDGLRGVLAPEPPRPGPVVPATPEVGAPAAANP